MSTVYVCKHYQLRTNIRSGAVIGWHNNIRGPVQMFDICPGIMFRPFWPVQTSNQQCLKIGNAPLSQKIACKTWWSYIPQNVGTNENSKVPSVFLPYKQSTGSQWKRQTYWMYSYPWFLQVKSSIGFSVWNVSSKMKTNTQWELSMVITLWKLLTDSIRASCNFTMKYLYKNVNQLIHRLFQYVGEIRQFNNQHILLVYTNHQSETLEFRERQLPRMNTNWKNHTIVYTTMLLFICL